jgi:hypothetical protein
LGDNTNQRGDDIITTTTGLPTIGTVLEGAVCVSIRAQERGVRIVSGSEVGQWEVHCRFGLGPRDVDTDQLGVGPIDRTPHVRWTGTVVQEELEYDAQDGSAIETANHEGIVLPVDRHLPVLEVTRYESWPFDPDVKLTYQDHVNSTPFYGAPSGCALLVDIDAEKEVINRTKYARVRYVVQFRLQRDPDTGAFLSDGFHARPLHEGYLVRDAAGGTIEQALDAYGNPIKVNLAANGTRLGDTADPVFLSFARYPEANLNDLNLGPY